MKQPKRPSRREFLASVGLTSGAFLLTTRAGSGRNPHAQPTVPNAKLFEAVSAAPQFAENVVDSKPRLIGDNQVIMGLDVLLNKDVIDPQHELIVFADQITIEGEIRLPGRKIFLHARQISSQGGALVNVTGNVGPSATKTVISTNPGQNGNNGDNGKSGVGGGQIVILAGQISSNITFLAQGGTGSDAAPGGDGVKGSTGDAGQNGNAGGPGRRGGDAGQGGDGGPGGPGGIVRIWTLSPVSDAENTQRQGLLRAGGGKGGLPGAKGKAGAGGNGGAGDTRYVVVHGRDGTGQPVDTKIPSGTMPDGPTGPPGSVPKDDPKPGQMGVSNPIASFWKPATQELLGSCSSMTQLLVLLHRAELDYLNENYSRSAISLTWIENISGKVSAIPDELLFRYPSVVVPPKDQEWITLNRRAKTLLGQLRAGLDFYGLPKSYVPLVSMQVYKGACDRILDIAEAIERSHDDFYNAAKSVEDKLTALRKALDTQSSAIDQIQNQVASLDNDASDAENVIKALLETILGQEKDLQATARDFQFALTQKARCEQFVGVMQCFYAIVSVAAGDYASVIDVVKSVNNLESSTDADLVVKNVQPISDDIDLIRSSFQQIRDDLNAHSDASKLLIAVDNYEKVLKPFMDMPQAQKYKALLDSYAHNVQSRNAKILDYSALLIRRRVLQAQIDHAKEVLARTQSTIVLNQDPTLFEFEAFMKAQLTEIKALSLRLLHQLSRSQEYWTLSETHLQLNDANVTTLKKAQGDLISAELTSRELRGRNFEPINDLFLTLSLQTHPEDFKRFLKGDGSGNHVLTFTPTEDEPAFKHGYAELYVDDVKVEIPGIESKDKTFTVILIHSGKSLIRDANRDAHYYTHRPRSTNITWGKLGNTPAGNLLGGDEKQYAYLSPYAVWSLRLNAADNSGLNLTKVKQVKVTFSGLFYPFSTPASS
jgi:hypothetical protein